jgi:hypothetical protein
MQMYYLHGWGWAKIMSSCYNGNCAMPRPAKPPKSVVCTARLSRPWCKGERLPPAKKRLPSWCSPGLPEHFSRIFSEMFFLATAWQYSCPPPQKAKNHIIHTFEISGCTVMPHKSANFFLLKPNFATWLFLKIVTYFTTPCQFVYFEIKCH